MLKTLVRDKYEALDQKSDLAALRSNAFGRPVVRSSKPTRSAMFERYWDGIACRREVRQQPGIS